MSVVVTGANGFIRMHTVTENLRRGYNVKAVGIRTKRLEEFSRARFSMMI